MTRKDLEALIIENKGRACNDPSCSDRDCRRFMLLVEVATHALATIDYRPPTVEELERQTRSRTLRDSIVASVIGGTYATPGESWPNHEMLLKQAFEIAEKAVQRAYPSNPFEEPL